jgi:site-specific recombinase XerD
MIAMGVYRRCGDILVVKQALAHRSITSTLVYAQCNHDRLQKFLAS